MSPKDFWKDIERVFVNAKAFNDSPEVYKAAAQLHEKANQFLKNKKLIDFIDVNSRASIEEGKHAIIMRKIGKELRKGIVPNGTKGYGSDLKHTKSMESLMHEKEVS